MTQHVHFSPIIDHRVLEILKHTLASIERKRGDCPASTLASVLQIKYPAKFKPDNWAGHSSFGEMLGTYGHFFEVYYQGDQKKNLMVRKAGKEAVCEVQTTVRPGSVLNIPDIVNTYFTDEICRKAVSRYDIPADLADPSRLRQILCYRLLRLEKEGKIIRPNKQFVCHTGLYTNDGVDPVYLLAVGKAGCLDVRTVERCEKDGRKMISILGNVEPQPVSFPRVHFDNTLEIVAEYGHILDDHPERLPNCLLEMVTRHPDYPVSSSVTDAVDIVSKYRSYLLRQLMGAVELVATKLRNGTVEAAPFWFMTTDRMCWLVPLELGIDGKASIALVLDLAELNGQKVYRAYTVLGLEDAYRSARLVDRVTAKWLADYGNGIS
ncbi:MAG: DUF3825 domain-containing protein [Duncaniella sp.]|nr:DUF3825 domain-containing protein [Duncaniella sp.]